MEYAELRRLAEWTITQRGMHHHHQQQQQQPSLSLSIISCKRSHTRAAIINHFIGRHAVHLVRENGHPAAAATKLLDVEPR